MLWNRQDAEDATQENLVGVVTRLAQFDFRSRLTTWVYRVAVNYLLDVRKSPVERLRLTFTSFADDLAQGLEEGEPGSAERSVLVEEVKVGCTVAMLQCLDRPHRLAYIVGEILDVSGPEAAEILQITSDAFRKQLQRARAEVVAFTSAHCELVSTRQRAHVTAASKRSALPDGLMNRVSILQIMGRHSQRRNPRLPVSKKRSAFLPCIA
jgi:RNA polymerase sigma factor (sigma-70 family)